MQARHAPRICHWWGVDPEAVYNLCLILKIMLSKSLNKYNYLFHDSFSLNHKV